MPPRMSIAYRILCVTALISLFSTIVFAELFQVSIPAFVVFLVTIFILGGLKR